eukprot:TRINITY_DN35879_c0_g1_i1.p1 TRINITY_DN35879_c0_g1~~TRINITY_DN35879_c0_g1_i1.p1  ORF type:complete len:235 (-),score=31.58 TRINITY_DN35879_c0_g1_i1:13-669(-)
MATPFATRLHETFETHQALCLHADDFLTVLRRAGATISVDEGAALVKKFRKDSGGRVDVQKFCAWFTGIEQEPRFAQTVSTSVEHDVSENTHAHLEQSDNEIAESSSDTSGDQSGGLWQGHEGGHNEENADDAHAVGDVEARVDGEGDDLGRRSLRFNRQVMADDDSFWSLGSEDKYTLPSHRRLTERERLMADFQTALTEVKARLETAPIILRTDLR